jgi:hypothetical protein
MGRLKASSQTHRTSSKRNAESDFCCNEALDHHSVTHLTEQLDQLLALQVVHTLHGTRQKQTTPQMQIAFEAC